MIYTREHGVLRILVGCLDYSKAPQTFPIYVKDGIYALSFEVEGEEKIKDSDDMVVDQDHDDDTEGDDDVGDAFRDAMAKTSLEDTSSQAGNGKQSVDAPMMDRQGWSVSNGPAASEVQTSTIVFSAMLQDQFHRVHYQIPWNQGRFECDISITSRVSVADG